jgi:L-asparaginase II
VAVHLSPADIAALLEVEPAVVVSAADQVGVPVYQGQIDRVLLAEALRAAGHPLGPVAAERLLRAGDAPSG